MGCDSTTVTPAIVYFPPGIYSISSPIVQLYYTHFVGDALSLPTIKATAGFQGIALLDSDPYMDGGANWYVLCILMCLALISFPGIPIRTISFAKFAISSLIPRLCQSMLEVGDLCWTMALCLIRVPHQTMAYNHVAGLHWQVAQATSLQNIVFNMRTDGGTQNAQQGIFMDNGSGGFMTDLVFNGGKFGAFFGNQQFTTRNLTFNNCQTAIYMNWNWAWTFQGITIDNCGVGIDMTNGGPGSQTVGSIILIDSTISNTPVGVATVYSPSQGTQVNGTLIIENVDMSNNVPQAVQNTQGGGLPGNAKIGFWAQGSSYTSESNSRKVIQGPQPVTTRPKTLLGASDRIFARSKPQYENVPVSAFKSVKAAGAKGDGEISHSETCTICSR